MNKDITAKEQPTGDCNLTEGSTDSQPVPTNAAAVASLGTHVIAKMLINATTGGEVSIVSYTAPNRNEQSAPLFRTQPGSGDVCLWAGDRGYKEQARAFWDAINPDIPPMVSPMPTPAGGRHV